MFEIFNKANELTLIFYDYKLCYANETALHYFRGFRDSLVDMPIEKFFEKKYIEKLKENLKDQHNFVMRMAPIGDKEYRYRVKILEDPFLNKYVFIQAIARLKDTDHKKEQRLIIPTSLYDPFMSGKMNILNYEIAEPYFDMRNNLESLIKKGGEDVDVLKDTVEILDRIYYKIIDCISNLVDTESKYDISKSIFNLNDFLRTIVHRLNSYYDVEDIDAFVTFTSITHQEPVISCDYYMFSKAIITIITEFMDIAANRGRRGKVHIELERDNGYANIIISGNVQLNKKTINEMMKENVEIIPIDGYLKFKDKVNMCMVNTYVELNGGELIVDLENKPGTKFMIRIPTARKRYILGECSNLPPKRTDE